MQRSAVNRRGCAARISTQQVCNCSTLKSASMSQRESSSHLYSRCTFNRLICKLAQRRAQPRSMTCRRITMTQNTSKTYACLFGNKRMQMAMSKLLQQGKGLSPLERHLLRAQGGSRRDAATLLVPHTRHKLLNIPTEDRFTYEK
jgi:hypothetical protein